MDGLESPESSGLSSPCSTLMPTQATIGPAEPPETLLSQFDISDIGEKLRGCGPRPRPSIPQKRGHSQGYTARKKRVNLILQNRSQFVLQSFSFSMSVPSFGSQDIKNIVKEALEPLINEIKGLKAEIQQLKTQKIYNEQSTSIKKARPIIEVEDSQKNQNKTKKTSQKIKIKKLLFTTKKATVSLNTVVINPVIASQKTFAEVLRSVTSYEN
jgi:hypothetical protein